MVRRENLIFVRLVALAFAGLSSGCVSIDDATPDVLVRASDGTYTLTAQIETYSTQPSNVRVAIGTRELPMVSVGGGRWQVNASLDGCAVSTIQLRYLVDYVPAVGTSATAVEPPGASATTGGLLKTFTALKNCATAPVRVNSAEYLHDSNPGDGICDANPAGTSGTPKCTLLAAIDETNRVRGAATILVPAGSYTTPAGDYFIPSDDVIIQGDDRDSVRIGQISAVAPAGVPMTVELRNMTLPFGARSNSGSLSLDNVLINDAHPSTVSGVVVAQGLLSINNSTIIGGAPDGVYFSGTHARITNSLIANTAGVIGGVVCIPPGSVQSQLEVINSTITGNRAMGGGVSVQGQCNALFRNTTISGNTITTTSFRGGGLTVGNSATVILSNTILADNHDSLGVNTDCAPFRGAPTTSVTLQSLGHNLIGTAGTCRFTATLGRPDLSGLSANLGALAFNGGPTQTLLPLATSPALGAGSPDPYGAAFPAACPHTDQRGIPRSGACTIGAMQP